MIFDRPTALLDGDLIDVYRLSEAGRNTMGDFEATDWIKVHSALAVNYHGTHNFDERIGGRPAPFILKKQNILTADVFTGVVALDIKAQDVIQLTTRRGRSMWLTVAGTADERDLTGYLVFYGTPTNAVA